ncbi:MAG: tryptophan 7-halogenase [Pseudomonadota bacterium]
MNTDGFDIVVCGDGLAGAMTALSLVNGLPETHSVQYVRTGRDDQMDALYGSVTAPTAYDFLRTLGLDEPSLFMRSGTTFCYGTSYQNWPGDRSWMQGYMQPFHTIAGVPLVHHLTRGSAALEPILVSAQAALHGRFAHPPEDANVPLSRAEYGYQFSVSDWTDLLDQLIGKSRAITHTAQFAETLIDAAGTSSIRLQNGDTLMGDLIVDCSGSQRIVIGKTDSTYESSRSIRAFVRSTPSSQLGWPYRLVQSNQRGWTSQTHLQSKIETLSIQAANDAEREDGLDASLGHLDAAWRGNCVAIGQAACTLEPLTPAPMILLQRDIERLLELIPVSDDLETERREFNRRFTDDVAHAALFQDAFYVLPDVPDHEFWQSAVQVGPSAKLKRKLAQFENRGVLVRFDLEPFNDEDWTILHFGMGRRPRNYDLQVEQIGVEESLKQIGQLKNAIAQMVPRMPPHHLYVANMKKYFEKQNYA